jgi:hypothetical protein
MANPNPYRDWMKKELGELIEQLQLDELQKRYLRSRWMDQVLWMEAKAGQTQFRYYLLRLLAIIGGVIVPALVGLNLTRPMNEIVRGVTFILSLAVAISVAVEEFFHYGERWRHYRTTVELLKSEGWQLFQLSGRYKQHASHADAYREFAEQIEQIIQTDVSKFITEVVREKKQGKEAAKSPE